MAGIETSQGMSAGQETGIGEMKMESEKRKGIEDYLNSGVEFLRASDWEFGEERKYKVISEEDRNFEDGIKPMLILKGLEDQEVGMVLNRTNLGFLKDEGFKTFDELFGKSITVKREERLFETKSGKRKNIGLFIVGIKS